MRKITLILISFLLSFTIPAQAIKLKLKKGESYRYKIHLTQIIKQNLKGHPATQTKLECEFERIIKVIKKTENGYTIELTQKNLKASYKDPYREIVYSPKKKLNLSETPAKLITLAIFESSPITANITEEGKLKSYKGVEEAVEKFSKKSDIKEREKKLLLNSMKKFFEESFELLSKELYQAPSCKKGVKWNIKKRLHDLPIEINTSYEIKDIKKNTAHIFLNSHINGSFEKKGFHSSKLTGKIEGFILIDLGTGMLKKSRITENLKIETKSFASLYPLITVVETVKEIVLY